MSPLVPHYFEAVFAIICALILLGACIALWVQRIRDARTDRQMRRGFRRLARDGYFRDREEGAIYASVWP